jgi:diguanylate cyclase (GGDEF)-like protein
VSKDPKTLKKDSSLYEEERFRIIFEYSPIAIWEEDFSALAKLKKTIESKNVIDIRKFLKSNPQLVTDTFRHIKVLDINQAALKLYGAQSKKELLANLGKTIHKEAHNVLIDEFTALIEGQSFFEAEFKSRDIKGRLNDVAMCVSVPELYKDTFERVIVTFQDISVQKQLEKNLTRLAQTDGLTKLLNHNTIIKRLEEEFNRARRYRLNLTCLMIDLDSFKKVNDEYGHQKGSQVLRMAAHMIKASLREVDIVGRYGGDEFLVILPETSEERAQIVAKRLKNLFEGQGENKKKFSKHVSLSIGLASYKQDKVKSYKDMITLSDKAMYVAKKTGGNQFSIA